MTDTWDNRSEAAVGARAPAVPLPWLTFEVAFYGLITLAALAVRLAALGEWPLDEVGVNTALAAWRTTQGSSWRPAYYSPLLYDANLLLFVLTRATDAAARLLPALAGAGLAFLPYLARDLLGRKGAFAASMLFAFAPSWVFFSRTADAPILTAMASALFLLGVYHYFRSESLVALQTSVVALALGLTAGPGIYTMLLAVALFALYWAWRRRSDPLLHDLGAMVSTILRRRYLLLFLGVFVFFGGGFLVNPGGIGASINLAGYWVGNLVPGAIDLFWWSYARNLLAYEFLTIALAVAGVLWGLRTNKSITIFLVIWFALALVLGTLLGHREPAWMLDALLPLVLLAALGTEALAERLLPEAGRAEAIILLLALPLLAFSALELFAYTQTGEASYLVYARVSWGIFIVAWIAYLIWGERGSALRVGAALVAIVMVMATVRITTAVAWQTGSDSREWLAYRPASVQLHDLQAFVGALSSRISGDAHSMDIEYEETLDPWIGWALRDFPKAHAVPTIGVQPEATSLITALRPQDEWPQGYAGQRFRLREGGLDGIWSPVEQWRWLIYRAPAGAVQADQVQVWIKLPQSNP